MFEIKVEAQFKTDYKRTMQSHPQLKTEFKAAVAELAAHGSLPAEYSAHDQVSAIASSLDADIVLLTHHPIFVVVFACAGVRGGPGRCRGACICRW